MDAAPAAPTAKPCCVCAVLGGKHCAKCKSRHYCSKECQLVDWYDRGHKAQCKDLAADLWAGALDADPDARAAAPEAEASDADEVTAPVAAPVALPAAAPKAATTASAKTAPKEAPPALKEAPKARASAKKMPGKSAGKTAADAETIDADAPDWRGTCAICLDLLPLHLGSQRFYECCCRKICTACHVKCRQYDDRCPLCRTQKCGSDKEWLRRIQKHVDKGDAEAQSMLGNSFSYGGMGLKKNLKRAYQLYQLAAQQGHARAQDALGCCYEHGEGVKSNHIKAFSWFKRAALQGNPDAQYNLGATFYKGKGVSQNFEDAVAWWHLAAAQGNPNALYKLGDCYTAGQGVTQDIHVSLQYFKAAHSKGYAGAKKSVEELEMWLEFNSESAKVE